MTEQEQNIAIAEALGWKKSGIIVGQQHYPRYKHSDGRITTTANLPRYTTDLNAMHEAEKVLTSSQKELYKCHLHEVTNSPLWGHGNIIHATASQRAEAFLRTIGKWKD